MNQFSDFNIVVEQKSFVGDKIKMSRLLNKKITVIDYKIQESKYDKGTGKCLQLQIDIEEKKHVVFTGSAYLMETIQKVQKQNFPFATTIVEQDERYQFT